MSYNISVQGHSEDEEGVREAFAYLVRSLRARGDVAGQLSDQSGGINAADVSSDGDPTNAAPDDETVTPAGETPEEFTPAESPVDTGPNAAAIDSGEPPVTFSTSAVPEPEGGQTFTADAGGEEGTDAVKTEPVTYDANDTDNPLNNG